MIQTQHKKRNAHRRTWIQLAAAALTNGYIAGFMNAKIYTGNSKIVCVPGLNCYSCPGALGACPIGSLQAVLGGRKHNFSYYVFGILILFGVVFGRLICGFLCPFGLFQDLLYKIPVKKRKIPGRIDKPLRWVKYGVLLLFVILLPIVATNVYGIAPPYFCKWICPAGTLEGGLPLLIANEELRSSLGFLFNWKVFLLLILVVTSVFVYRPFCKYVCPLGAFYSLFNKISVFQMEVDPNKCTGCKACERACKMGVKITRNINALECIRCGACKDACPQEAITSRLRMRCDKSAMRAEGTPTHMQ